MYIYILFFCRRERAETRSGNPERTISKMNKIELDNDSYGKNIDKSIGVVKIDQNVLLPMLKE